MNRKIKIVIADRSEDFREMLKDLIEEQEDLRLVGSAGNGTTAMDLVKMNRPDVLLMDLMLQELDGLSVLKELRREGIVPRTIVISGFFSDAVASQLSQLGVDYYFPKPCRTQELAAHIRELALLQETQRRPVKDFDVVISEALGNAGIVPSLQGYRYLRDSIRRTIVDKNTLQGVTKILYPELAKQYGVTQLSVERAMRHAIYVAWKKGDSQRRQLYFGDHPSFRSRPVCTVFIAAMAEFIENRYFKEENFI